MTTEFTELFSLLDRLHRKKDATYGDAWQRRGEVLGIFCNIARKYDRLAAVLDDPRPSIGETLGDTLADLSVYAVKYTTWLAERHAEAFDQIDLGVSAARASASRGPEAVTGVLDAISSHSHWGRRAEPETARATLDRAFGRLDQAMQASATGVTTLDDGQRITISLELATASASLWLEHAARDRAMMAALRRAVEPGEVE